MKNIIPLDPNNLTIEDIIKSMSSLMFLVKKRDSTIKARICADGIKQISSDSYNKHYYASSTCSDNSVMVIAAIEAKEVRDGAVIDIPGTYLHTYVDKYGKQRIIMFLKGKFAELMVMVDPNL